jgi:Mrp family chromosome partitioning ATPase
MADTPVLCRSVDGVVLVVAAEHSSRSDVRRTIGQVTAVRGTIVGAVLQRVDLARNFYYYGRYYKEYYRDDSAGSDAAAYPAS